MARIEITIDEDFATGSGVASTISWKNLELLLKKDNKVYSNETIEGFVVDDYGIKFYIKRKEEDGS